MRILSRILLRVAVAGVGLFMTWRGAVDWESGSRSTGWSTVAGTVLESRAEPPTRGSSYQVHVSYRYKISGQVYVGDRVAFGTATKGNKQAVDGILSPYPAGAEVQVHYDPANPDDSVLQAGWTWRSVLEVMLGVLMLITGLVGRMRRRGA